MTDPTPVTRAQKVFLRTFRQNPTGPAPADWPAPGVLRRWLKDRRFRAALTAVRDAIRFQTDFHLAAAASTAARAVQTTLAQSTLVPATTTDSNLDPTALADLSKSLKSLTDLLRLAHLRERFTTPPRNAHRRRPTPADPDAAEPDVYAEILDDPERLKCYMLLSASRGSTAYDAFLAAFPDELAAAHAPQVPYVPPAAPPSPTPA